MEYNATERRINRQQTRSNNIDRLITMVELKINYEVLRTLRKEKRQDLYRHFGNSLVYCS